MRDLFSLCSVMFLIATCMSTIILVDSVPNVIKISDNQYLVSIDTPTEKASKVKKNAPHKQDWEEPRHNSERSGLARKKTEAWHETGHIQTVTQSMLDDNIEKIVK